MKKNIFLKVTSFLVIALHMSSMIAGTSSNTEDVAIVQSEAVVDATAETKLLLNEAKSVMDKARQQLFSGIIDANNAAILIKGQVAIVAHVKQQLQQIITQAVQKVETEQGYLDYFISGAKNLGNKIIAPFKTDYGYTQEHKEVASKIIAGLIDQQDKLTKQYAQLPLKKRTAVKDSYQSLIAALNDEINQQQLIAGDALDAKKIFYAVALAGAAVAGMALLAPGEAAEIIKETSSNSQQSQVLGEQQSTEPASQIPELTNKVAYDGPLAGSNSNASDSAGLLPDSQNVAQSLPYLKAEQDRIKEELEKKESAIDPTNLPENPKAIAKTHEEYVAGLSEEDAERQREHDINMGYVSGDVPKQNQNADSISNQESTNLEDEGKKNPDNGTNGSANKLPENESTGNSAVQPNPGSTEDKNKPNQETDDSENILSPKENLDNTDDQSNSEVTNDLGSGNEGNPDNRNDGSKNSLPQDGNPDNPAAQSNVEPTKDVGREGGDKAADGSDESGNVLQQGQNLGGTDNQSKDYQGSETSIKSEPVTEDKIKDLYIKIDNFQAEMRAFLVERSAKGDEKAKIKLQDFDTNKEDDYKTLARRINAGEDINKISKELEDAITAINSVKAQQLIEESQSPDLTNLTGNAINTGAEGSADLSQPGQNQTSSDTQSNPVAPDNVEVTDENDSGKRSGEKTVTDEDNDADEQGDKINGSIVLNLLKEQSVDTKKLIHL